MATDLTQRLHEETQKANAARASGPGTGAQLAAGGLTFRPGATPAPQAPQVGYAGNSTGGGSASPPAHPVSAGITVNPFGNDRAPGSGANLAARGLTVDPSNLNPGQRSAAAFAYSQGIDRATGTGPGAYSGALAARKGIDMGVIAKRFDTYQKDPNALAMANTREDLLGSGISLTHGPAGGLTITSNGIGKGALPAAGGSSINMQEANAVMARANAIRQGMIDTPELAAKQAAEAQFHANYDAKYGGRDPRRVEAEGLSANGTKKTLSQTP